MIERTILCKESGVAFQYSGRGRPPLYCVEVAARKILERQRKASRRFQERKRAEKKDAKRAAGIEMPRPVKAQPRKRK